MQVLFFAFELDRRPRAPRAAKAQVAMRDIRFLLQKDAQRTRGFVAWRTAIIAVVLDPSTVGTEVKADFMGNVTMYVRSHHYLPTIYQYPVMKMSRCHKLSLAVIN